MNKLVTFSDIFKQSFIENWANQSLNTSSAILTLLIAFVLALYIFFVYRLTTQKTFYSKSFNISMVGVALITAAIIITIQSSIVISLGMVGALSIVRFRTAIKNPMDLMYLFWAVSVGIICGAGYSIYAIILSVLLTLAIILLEKLPVATANMILVVNSIDLDAESKIMLIVKNSCKHAEVKSRNMTQSSLTLTIEMRVADGHLVKEIQEVDGTTSVSLLSHNGEVSF